MIALSGSHTAVCRFLRTSFTCFAGTRCILLAALALGACGDAPEQIEISRVAQTILGGVVDNAHPEVMLLSSRQGFVCTGTVIRTEQERGFLLTAAHCVTEDAPRGRGVVTLAAEDFLVVPGTDVAESRRAFSVESVSVEPSYDGSFAAGDVAIVRFFFGKGAAPGAIAPLSSGEDNLAIDDELLLVGYGQSDVNDANSQRRRVERTLGELDRELLAYTQEDGKGACFGDSGGPVFVEVGGEERVAGVISSSVGADEDCSGGVGLAMRVSHFDAFIEAVLTGQFPD